MRGSEEQAWNVRPGLVTLHPDAAPRDLTAFGRQIDLVTPEGFEPSIFALKGRGGAVSACLVDSRKAEGTSTEASIHASEQASLCFVVFLDTLTPC